MPVASVLCILYLLSRVIVTFFLIFFKQLTLALKEMPWHPFF